MPDRVCVYRVYIMCLCVVGMYVCIYEYMQNAQKEEESDL